MSRSARAALYAQWRMIAATHARRVQRARRALAEAHAAHARARGVDLAAQRAIEMHRRARERLAVVCLGGDDGAAGFAWEALRVNLRDEAVLRRERDVAREGLARASDALATCRGAVLRAEKRYEEVVRRGDAVIQEDF
jgi:hypothetical protein